MTQLLTRVQFRTAVFERDKHKCVLCGAPAVDAHHIIERRLFPDSGYYLDNGASVCSACHLECERTNFSPIEVRQAAGITKTVLPPHLYDDQEYDKWGNPILANGRRLKGDLFFDESVQLVIAEHLHKFDSLVKYPRTYHLPWSDNITDDDRVIESLGAFVGSCIITEKMDGENTTMYSDHIHARSVDGRSHPSRDWVKNFWSRIRHDIPEGWRICGENMFAKHSIEYKNLPSYFLGFSIWNNHNICLSWDETEDWFNLLGIASVPCLSKPYFLEKPRKCDVHRLDEFGLNDQSEGYVLRLRGEISYRDFRYKVGKYVRKNHVMTVNHWMYGQTIVPNSLA
jgi:hypothetical protein